MRLAEVLDKERVAEMSMTQVFDYSIGNYTKHKEFRGKIWLYLNAELIALQSLYNISKENKMDDAQVGATVDIIIQENPALSLRDFAMFFRTVKAGRITVGRKSFAYGKIYNRIDIGIINDWLDTYMEARSEARLQSDTEAKEQAIITMDNWDARILSSLSKSIEEANKERTFRQEWLKTQSADKLAELHGLAMQQDDREALRLIEAEMRRRAISELADASQRRYEFRLLLQGMSEAEINALYRKTTDTLEKEVIEKYLERKNVG